MAVETVVFVLGSHTNAAFPWMFHHFDPDKDTAPPTVKLAFFDFPAGKLRIWNSLVLKRSKTAPSAAPDTETDLTPTTHLRMRDGKLDTGPERPTVVALYDWVKAQPAGTIRSLQIFSHGWAGGPILFDTWEFDDATGNEISDRDADRDAHDTDFRTRDFRGNNPLAGAEGKKFRDAFTTDPFVKIWGCVAPEDAREPLRNFMRVPKGAANDGARQAHLKDYLKGVGSSFAMWMAAKLDLSVWASPFGWGADYGSNVPTIGKSSLNVTYQGVFPPDLKRDHWWRVSWLFKNSDPGARFYRDVLKTRLDAVDYVEYRKAWFVDALNAATASVTPSPVTTPRGLQQRLQDRIAALSSGVAGEDA